MFKKIKTDPKTYSRIKLTNSKNNPIPDIRISIWSIINQQSIFKNNKTIIKLINKKTKQSKYRINTKPK